MFTNVLKCLVLFHTLFSDAQAFWWAPPTTTTRTTTAEPSTVLKQIPLTYFRTYTYQPLAGNPFTFPFYGAHMQTPLLAGPRYEHVASNYGGNKYPHMGQLLPQEPVLAAKPPPNTAPTAPPTTTTTSTTTTTTTPAPTTTTSTSSTTTTTTAAPPPPPPAQPLIGGAPLPAYDSAYPTYNRRAYLGAPQYPYRPHYPYPYPEYSLYKSQPQTAYAPSGGATRGGAHIQFVPCMCPVTVSGNGLQPMPGSAAYLAQARTANGDDDMLAEDDDDMALPADKTEADNPSKSTITIEPEPEAEAEEESVDAAAQTQNVTKPLEAVTAQLTTNKIDGETQTDSEAGV